MRGRGGHGRERREEEERGRGRTLISSQKDTNPVGSGPLMIHFIFFFKFSFYIGVELIYNIVLVSGIQKNDSFIHFILVTSLVAPSAATSAVRCMNLVGRTQTFSL